MDPLVHSRNEKGAKQYFCSDTHPSKKAKTVQLVGNVMAAVFWDSNGIMLLDLKKEKGAK